MFYRFTFPNNLYVQLQRVRLGEKTGFEDKGGIVVEEEVVTEGDREGKRLSKERPEELTGVEYEFMAL